MRRLYLLTTIILILAHFQNVFSASRIGRMAAEIQEFQQDSTIRYGQWGLVAIDTETGKVLLAENPNKTLAPASCLKTVTSAAAIELLGPDYRFETRLEYDGYIKDSVLYGNLYIIGGGDPTLGTSRIDSVLDTPELITSWTKALRDMGIRDVYGDIIADDEFFDNNSVPAGWPWIDLGNYYGAGTSGLCLNENLYKLVFKPGKRAGEPAQIIRTEPIVPGLAFINYMKTGHRGSGDNGYIFGAPNQWRHTLRGTVPAGPAEFTIKGSLPNPAKLMAQLFKAELEMQGRLVQGRALTSAEDGQSVRARTVLFRYYSPELRDIVYFLNKRSINLYAEQLIKVIGKEKGSGATLESGIQVVEKFLKDLGVSTGGLFLHDGSGLSPFNRITPQQLAQMLAKMTRKDSF
ncbi:D-alanyl-D-alanine carboxypeptidase/D-alanyl-D-alanine-endopeptidase, partial [bacterium]|nr:D-alanyl-D-alanine carboxypeptidase/D-alanyl-D-alanine-endopeptidase [bacterium]